MLSTTLLPIPGFELHKMSKPLLSNLICHILYILALVFVDTYRLWHSLVLGENISSRGAQERNGVAAGN